jgi:hypothetical protein
VTQTKKAYDAARYLANREQVRARRRAYYKANLEKALAYSASWQKANPEKVREYGASYRENNPEKDRTRKATYRRARPGQWAEYTRRRQATKQRACPPWAKKDPRIRALYFIAAWLRKKGDPVEVDHLYPLNPKGGPQGLHVYANLRIVPTQENRRKHNRQPTQDQL